MRAAHGTQGGHYIIFLPLAVRGFAKQTHKCALEFLMEI